MKYLTLRDRFYLWAHTYPPTFWSRIARSYYEFRTWWYHFWNDFDPDQPF